MATTDARPATLGGLVAARRSDAPALICDGRTMSYAGLDDAARRAARGLADLGIGPGDRVALWLPNGLAWPVLFLACARLGAIAVAVNTRFRSAEVQDILGRAGCRALALRPGFKGIDFAGILAGIDPAAVAGLETLIDCPEEGDEGAAGPPLPGRRLVGYGALAGRPPLDEDRGAPDLGCLIFTTSGTTSAPKFVLHTHGSIVRHGLDVARAFGYAAPETVGMAAVPLCGTFGLAQATAVFAAGRPLVLMPLFEPEAAVRLVREHRVTAICGSDDMIARMLEAAGGAERPLPSLEWYGYAKFNPALVDIVERAEARAVRMRGLWGMSEAQALFAAQPLGDPERRGLPGGVPVSPEAAARVRDPESGRLLPEGESGEIEVRGPSLMAGYYGDPGATRAATTEDGFFKTGDLGYATAGGGFVFQTRMGDVLRLGGFLVGPAEIEAHLLRHPGVDGCQVVGATGPKGLRAVAFVTLKPGGGFDEGELRAFCRSGLAGFKVPERIIPLDAFPTTDSPNGLKIQRGKLRRMAEAELAAAGG